MGSPNMIALSQDWLSTTWGELVELKYGKALKGYKESNGEFPVYGTNGPVGWCEKPLCEFPSVIVGRKGAYRGIHFSEKPFYVIDTAFYIQPKPDVDINLKWAYYALLLADINSMDSGSAIPSTSREDFYALSASMPPRDIQDWIVSQLDALNDKIELNHQINTTLESMAQALFKSWFVDFDPVIDNALAAGNPIPEPFIKRATTRAEHRKSIKESPVSSPPPLPADIQQLFPSSFVLTEEMGWVPEGWAVSCVGEEFNVTMGQSPPGHTYNEVGDGMAFFQGRADFGFRYPANRIYCTQPKRLASKGDTLVSVRAPVGDVNMAANDCCIGRGVSASRHRSGSKSYTYYAMRQLQGHFKIYEGEGTVFGSINQKDFKALSQLKIPSILIQKFQGNAGSLDKKIDLNSRNTITLTELRDSLLPKLLSGQLQIPDAEAVVEQAMASA